MADFKTWMKATRVPFLTATVVPILLGSVIAWSMTGSFSWNLFFLMLFSGIFIHLGINVSNDFYDHLSGNDEINENVTPLSGGSRVIQEKLVPAKQMFVASILLFLAGAALGLYLNFAIPGNVLLWLGLIGIFVGFFYTSPPFKLGYRGFGEVAVVLGFGPLLVLAALYVQTQTLSLDAFLIAIPVGILIALVLTINSFPDYVADKKTKKNTLVVLLGKRTVKNLYIALILISYAIVVVEAFYGIVPYWSLIVFLSLPIAFKAISTINKYYDKIEELLPANKATIGLHFSFGLLFALSYVLDHFF